MYNTTPNFKMPFFTLQPTLHYLRSCSISSNNLYFRPSRKYGELKHLNKLVNNYNYIMLYYYKFIITYLFFRPTSIHYLQTTVLIHRQTNNKPDHPINLVNKHKTYLPIHPLTTYLLSLQ